MEKDELKNLETMSKKIRLRTVKQLFNLGFGHYGGSLSIVETLAVLYGKVMNVDPQNPNDENRDFFVLSKGHAGPALYSALSVKGFFDKDLLKTLNQNGTTLPSHPDKNLTKGVDMTTGSLGQGLSVACGISKSLLMDGRSKQYVYCIVGDGELNEGQCWEAAQFAPHNELENLIVFVDYNKKQLDGFVKDVSGNENIEGKFRSFGFFVQTVDGKNIEEIYDAILRAKEIKLLPSVIVLDTTKGQGFSFVEEKFDNHHIRPNEEEQKIIANYIEELEKELGGDI